jgi:uroporphyrinogen III methyltransferase/synthase
VFVSATTRAGEDFDWTELSQLRGTICVLMGMHKLGAVIASLIEKARRDPATAAAVVQWGTRAEQAVVCGRLDEIEAQARARGLSSPAVIVVGAVAGLASTLRWFDQRPLFGKRVLITRPKGQASATSELVRLRGGEAVEWPVISIEAPPDPERVRRAVREVGGYDVVAFTSENGVAWFFREIDAAGRDARSFGHARVAAIGPGTAAALATRGVRADIVPAEFRGEVLAKAILDDPATVALRASGRAPRVLIARARVAREVLVELLRQGGCVVDVVAVYETRPAPIERQRELVRMFEEKRIDIVLFTASSTVDSLCDLLGARAAGLLEGVMLASIGPVTSQTAERRGLGVQVTAEVSTTAGLLDALERALSPRG